MNHPASTGEAPDTDSSERLSLGDSIVLILSIGFIVTFLSLSLYDVTLVAESISKGFAWTALALGSYF